MALRRFGWMLPLAVLVLVVVAGASRFAQSSPGGASVAGATAAITAIDPAPFPDPFDYPQKRGVIPQWVQKGQGSRIREHGWYLFAGLNQTTADGTPVWRTWYTTTQAFPYQYNPSGGSAAARPTTFRAKALAGRADQEGNSDLTVPGAPYYPVPAQVQHDYPECILDGQVRDGEMFQSPGDLMIAAVSFNKAAFDWIQQNRLYDAAILDAGLPPGQDSRANTVEFPREAIVLKPMLWPVKGDGYTALPVWDDRTPAEMAPMNRTYSGFEIQSRWDRAVAVTAQASPAKQVDVQYLYGVRTADQSQPTVP
jgi:hypothetical protein